MRDCVGFVFEPYSNSDRGACTYFSRIDSVETVDSDGILAVTTAPYFKDLSM